jgi:serine/threonine protein kinase
MEYCDLNLSEFTAGQKARAAGLMDWPKSDRYNQVKYAVSRIMSDVIKGIEWLHTLGLVHRDLSQDNGTPSR